MTGAQYSRYIFSSILCQARCRCLPSHPFQQTGGTGPHKGARARTAAQASSFISVHQARVALLRNCATSTKLKSADCAVQLNAFVVDFTNIALIICLDITYDSLVTALFDNDTFGRAINSTSSLLADRQAKLFRWTPRRSQCAVDLTSHNHAPAPFVHASRRGDWCRVAGAGRQMYTARRLCHEGRPDAFETTRVCYCLHEGRQSPASRF
jgi:hypothetical protein